MKPGGSIALFNAARAWAGVRGRDFVIPDDVKLLAEPTLAHRIIVGPAARMRGIESRRVVRDLLGSVPITGGGRAAGQQAAYSGSLTRA